MKIVQAQHQQTFTTPNAAVVPLATPSLGAAQVSVIRQRMAPGHQNPAHTQTHEEVMVMLGGAVTLTVAGESAELRRGDTAIIPAQTPHSLSNVGQEDAEWLIVSTADMQFHGADGKLMTPEWAR
ncbi:cupin domain-containing protein [Deinococcus radiopugnans]|uniref:Cupin domain-containing protein n=1 Tax=Deinococcus radiopugnans ATCC 19172 TaxID=585398 RepID=A0A5C4YCQ1_9DEIO|nr:cupin domain-containing protein [Deinococcus radiopugnans]MBB6015404.1 quercetin dioxygenase-like cupin family protein [Deinococcus radiopugnans ATCC 19172]TNM72909.1 cupin domain-containing protein [Deinococcus radiopugnans ATCC 19172]